MPDVSSAKAFRAIVDRIKTIQGSTSGHFTNLEGRVYTRHWLPENNKPAMPYVCIPMVTPAGAPDNDEGNLIRNVFEVTLIGYIPERSSADDETSTIEEQLGLLDDIFDVFMQDWTLGGQAQETSIAGWDLAAGEPPVAGYARMVVRVRVKQYLSDQVLGP